MSKYWVGSAPVGDILFPYSVWDVVISRLSDSIIMGKYAGVDRPDVGVYGLGAEPEADATERLLVEEPQ